MRLSIGAELKLWSAKTKTGAKERDGRVECPGAPLLRDGQRTIGLPTRACWDQGERGYTCLLARDHRLISQPTSMKTSILCGAAESHRTLDVDAQQGPSAVVLPDEAVG